MVGLQGMAFRRAPGPRLGGFGLALALAVGSWLAARPGLAAGNDGAEPARDAGLPTAPTSPAEDPRAQHIRDLVAGALDPRLEPQSLFDVSLEDEAAVQAEVLRLRALLARIDEAAARPTGGGSRGTARGVGLDDGGPSAELRAQARRLFEARLETDRAQLAFYELERARRTALLRDHAARRAASLPAESEAERSRRVLEEERARALEAARVARSEAERAVSEEQARLLALEADVRAVRAGFERSREALAVRRDATLGWQRRAREARGAGPVEADATYDALRRALRAARDELAEALSTLGRRDSSVPELGPDPLRDIPGDVSREAQLALRASLADTIAEARRAERSLLEDRACGPCVSWGAPL